MSWPAQRDSLHASQLRTFAELVTYIPGDGLATFTTRNADGEALEGIFVAPHVEAPVAAQVGVNTTVPTLGLRLTDLDNGLQGREIISSDKVTVAGDTYAIGEKEPDGRGWVHLFLHKAKAIP